MYIKVSLIIYKLCLSLILSFQEKLKSGVLSLIENNLWGFVRVGFCQCGVLSCGVLSWIRFKKGSCRRLEMFTQGLQDNTNIPTWKDWHKSRP